MSQKFYTDQVSEKTFSNKFPRLPLNKGQSWEGTSPFIGNESAPKIIINDTISLFF